MVHLGIWEGKHYTLNIKSNCVTFSLSGNGVSRVYSFDHHGRWWTGIIDGISYRRGLDGKVIAKWISGSETRDRKWLPGDESERIEEDIRQEFRRFVADLSSGKVDHSLDISSSNRKVLEKITSYTLSIAKQDVLDYHRVYKPVGILPPDQYMAVVTQLTEGCSFNLCTFCTFYRDRPFRIKSLTEFEEHLQSIKTYLGAGLSLRRTLFLGDANALVTPMKRLIPMIELVHKYFDISKLGGIYAFLDGFSGEKKKAGDYRQMRELGLKRIYIGLESGNGELLKFLNKPGSPADVLQAVDQIKTGGVSVGIIILLGAGGKHFDKVHRHDTVNLINQMNLDLDDIIYFSELIESEGLAYTQKAYQANLIPLSDKDRIVQAEMIENGLVFSPKRGVPHISRYDIREFVY